MYHFLFVILITSSVAAGDMYNTLSTIVCIHRGAFYLPRRQKQQSINSDLSTVDYYRHSLTAHCSATQRNATQHTTATMSAHHPTHSYYMPR